MVENLPTFGLWAWGGRRVEATGVRGEILPSTACGSPCEADLVRVRPLLPVDPKRNNAPNTPQALASGAAGRTWALGAGMNASAVMVSRSGDPIAPGPFGMLSITRVIAMTAN